jgi:hypothetical protein
LLNAAVSLRAAERRLRDGQLGEQVRAIVQSVGETVDLTRRAKQTLLHEWRAAEGAATLHRGCSEVPLTVWQR